MATSLQPYNTTLLRPGYYYIIKDTQIEYACFLASYDYLFKGHPSIADKVFGFRIELLNKKDSIKQKGSDERLEITVAALIKNFLSFKINAVVYVCDNTDDRQAVRFKKFIKWFEHADDGSLIHLTGFLKAYGAEYYNAILLHKDNILKNKFIKAFQELNNQTGK